MIIALTILAVITAALADGFNERGWKDVGHTIEMLEKPALILAGFLAGWIVLIPYVALRIALFDPIKNVSKGQNWLYVGEGWWDRLIKRIPPAGMAFIRVLFLWFGIGFMIFKM